MSGGRIKSLRDIEKAIGALAKIDRRFGEAFDLVGMPPKRLRSGGFSAVLHMIVGQQVSVASAAAIWLRVEAGIRPLTPDSVLAMSQTDLLSLGLSRPKARYARTLAQAVANKSLSFARVHRLPDEDAIAELTKVVGIGRWTAEIYLLSAMGRPDIFPAGDLALQAGAQMLFGLPTRPSEKEMAAMALDWAPWRAVAARLLWHYYAHGPRDK